ncbi:MAG TPA: nicotinate (nicotinamide) nucleotide adenylyltransferase [Bacteroidia bacterium]|jgi:nicotinate-nucleotide adenylyltransferase|nr:nicotinate (nicotinamide) nucleotide adenylyltransferase [Bacteroidia bacterium]
MKVGLFFGSFNPVHVGHMVLANYMLAYTELDQVWFVISPHNPLKKKASLLHERHRLRLVELAIGDNPKLKTSDIEFALSQPSYTVNTLVHLREKHPSINFALIMGEDNLQNFHKWKNYEEILKQHELYVYPRYDMAATTGDPSVMKHTSVKRIAAPLVEISSTAIRQAILEKKDMRYFVPLAAWEYIKEMHFYEK